MKSNYFSSEEYIPHHFAKEIGKSPVLSRAEESILIEKAQAGSKAARDLLIRSNLRFALKVSLKYRGQGLSLSELLHEASLGLAYAIENFENGRGMKFITYAVWWIRAALNRAINSQGSLIRLPSNRLLKLRQAVRQQRLNNEPLSDEDQELLALSGSGYAWDQALGEEGQSWENLIPAPVESQPGKQLEIDQDRHSLNRSISKLKHREQKLLHLVYGFNEEQKTSSLRETAQTLGISFERVRQLRDSALEKLRRENSLGEILESHAAA